MATKFSIYVSDLNVIGDIYKSLDREVYKILPCPNIVLI